MSKVVASSVDFPSTTCKQSRNVQTWKQILLWLNTSYSIPQSHWTPLSEVLIRNGPIRLKGQLAFRDFLWAGSPEINEAFSFYSNYSCSAWKICSPTRYWCPETCEQSPEVVNRSSEEWWALCPLAYILKASTWLQKAHVLAWFGEFEFPSFSVVTSVDHSQAVRL